MSEKERVTISINAELKFQLKMLALKKDVSMGELLEPTIREFIEANKEKLE